MTEPMIMMVDRDTYISGKREPHFWSNDKTLKFYDFRCNWTANQDTQCFFHVLAHSYEQAEDTARKEYARKHYISENFVKVL